MPTKKPATTPTRTRNARAAKKKDERSRPPVPAVEPKKPVKPGRTGPAKKEKQESTAKPDTKPKRVRSKKKEKEPAVDAANGPTAVAPDENAPIADAAEVETIEREASRLFDAPAQLGNALAMYLKDLDRYPPLQPEEEQRIARKARRGDAAAQERLVMHNLRFVVAIARQYAGRSIPLDDIIQAGNIGMVRAVVRFRPDKKVRLISYAVYWVRQAIRTALADTGRAVRLPLNRAIQLSHIHRAMDQLQEKLRRPATPAEIADFTEIGLHHVKTLLTVRQTEVSLDSAEGLDAAGERGVPLAERLPAEHGTVEQLDRRFRQDDLDAALEKLPARDAMILRLFFGLDNGHEHTLEEIGDLLHITRERVRQLRDRALKRLQAMPEVAHLREYLP